MAFFQALLLLGYGYAHLAVRVLGVRRQALVHFALLATPLAVLPIAVSREWSPSHEAGPVASLLGLLAATAGLPYFLVSSTAPLLQRWFAGVGDSAEKDPYFLYAASNAGSLIGLLAYPAIVEPLLPLSAQGRLWTWGYISLLALIGVCVWLVRRSPVDKVSSDAIAPRAAQNSSTGAASWRTRMRWGILAFVPSSMLLGVTGYITADIAPAPMLWIVPLAIYLLSYILAFSRWPLAVHRATCRALPLAALALAYVMLGGAAFEPRWLVLHLGVFFVAAMACHAELALSRPGVERLTEFYLWVSLGGVAGGLFSALLAPLIFTMSLEYPLTLALACCCCPPWRSERAVQRAWLMAALPIAAGLLTAVLFRWGAAGSPWRIAIPLLGCGLAVRRPVLFGACLGAVVLIATSCKDADLGIVYRERNFYGTLWIARGRNNRSFTLGHGSVFHGAQNRSDDPRIRALPLLYYFPSGPIGQAFHELHRRDLRPRTAVIGLGAGALASYGTRGEEITFFELDPAVARIAKDADFFTFLSDSAARTRVVLGDARLSLQLEPDGAYDLIVVDAFSGDAVPVHLLTREAIALYRNKLAAHGVIAFHVTNAYVDLAPVLADVAHAEHMIAIHNDELRRGVDAEEARMGKIASHWLLMACSQEGFGRLADLPVWEELPARPGARAWSDDYSDLLSAIRWR